MTTRIYRQNPVNRHRTKNKKMDKKIINKDTGELCFDNGFVVSKNTTLEELLRHFGKDKITKSEYNRNVYILQQQKLGKYYLKFYFYFGKQHLNKIEFEVETKPIERIPWSSNRDVETRWIARQLNDKSNFKWDMNKAGRHYHLQYDWGSIGVYYDFKNGTFSSVLVYK